MKRVITLLLLTAACVTSAWAADPYIGCVYPAGGQTGTTVKIDVGGQRIRGVRDVYFSGNGVRATFVRYEGPNGLLNKPQQDELKNRLTAIMAQRGRDQSRNAAKNKQKLAGSDSKQQKVTLPDIPELRDLENQSPKQLQQIRDRFLNRAKRPKQPIAETVTLEVTIDPDAAPGDREMRLVTINGLSNPIIFQIGNMPEVREPVADGANTLSPAAAPVVLNGQIMPGETDSFPLKLKQGQQLAIVAQARHLIPYLADAVPGWFQALLTLRDPDGKTVACEDHCGFDPDPVIFYKVPRDGNYTLSINDTLYRGRRDFVYRVVVAEEQQSKSLFPSGSRGGIPIGSAGVDISKAYSEMVGQDLPQQTEVEPNDKGQQSQQIKLPRVIRGSIARPGDVDVFKFGGRAGDEVVLEVYARRLGSPMDSLVRLINESGKVVATNDDDKTGEMALITHRADSYLSAKLPATGTYYVQISDAQQHGGSNYGYYLRISSKIPNFVLRMSPSSVSIPIKHTAPITVYAFRRDGFGGDIDVSLTDTSSGFTLGGVRIPAGRDSVQMTLTAPNRISDRLLSLKLEGHATINGKKIAREVVPTDRMMQAFAYHHLVPSNQLLAMLLPGGRTSPSFSLQKNEALNIPSGGQVQVAVTVRPVPDSAIHLELSNPPAGVTLEDVKTVAGRLSFTIKADSKHVGYADNLIVNAFVEGNAKSNDSKKTASQRTPIGTLPAIPFRIVP